MVTWLAGYGKPTDPIGMTQEFETFAEARGWVAGVLDGKAEELDLQGNERDSMFLSDAAREIQCYSEEAFNTLIAGQTYWAEEQP